MRQRHPTEPAILCPPKPVSAHQLAMSSFDAVAWMHRLRKALRSHFLAPLLHQIVAQSNDQQTTPTSGTCTLFLHGTAVALAAPLQTVFGKGSNPLLAFTQNSARSQEGRWFIFCPRKICFYGTTVMPPIFSNSRSNVATLPVLNLRAAVTIAASAKLN
jgi:hypothetical protein